MTSEEKRPLLTPRLSTAKRLNEAAELQRSKKTPCFGKFKERRRQKGLKKFYDYQTYLVECYNKDSTFLEDGAEANKEDHTAETNRKRKIDSILAQVIHPVSITRYVEPWREAFEAFSLCLVKLQEKNRAG